MTAMGQRARRSKEAQGSTTGQRLAAGGGGCSAASWPEVGADGVRARRGAAEFSDLDVCPEVRQTDEENDSRVSLEPG
ncbi:uncharacterized protein A4U43_C03F26350 [Asparagus officinalis]|uniref:Uncharacterized protein n=1 Tax=Asparagus officinalis TaxID=4686 RepID=A0A5P1FHE6_ASPOF|nr:uncharacterized protein A4U43_C03F26350 [Asparagus officinalis]